MSVFIQSAKIHWTSHMCQALLDTTVMAANKHQHLLSWSLHSVFFSWKWQTDNIGRWMLKGNWFPFILLCLSFQKVRLRNKGWRNGEGKKTVDMSDSLPPCPKDTNKTPGPLSVLICGPEAGLSGLVAQLSSLLASSGLWPEGEISEVWEWEESEATALLIQPPSQPRLSCSFRVTV